MDQQLLQDIAEILNTDSLNYSVFLQVHEMPLPKPPGTAALIKMALGTEAVLGEIKDVQSTSVWPVVEEALLYRGDDSAGPSAAIIKSEKLATAIGMLKGQVAELVSTATRIESFGLKDGHPAYPVFWDFAFLFSSDASATILIGSSSD